MRCFDGSDTGVDPELGEHRGQVMVDGAYRTAQPIGDFRVAHALAQEAQHLQLAVCQPVRVPLR